MSAEEALVTGLAPISVEVIKKVEEAPAPPPPASAFLQEDKVSDEGKKESEIRTDQKAPTENVEVKDEENPIFSDDKMVFITVPQETREADCAELISIDAGYFKDNKVAYVDGFSLYPYQQTAGPDNGFWNIVAMASSGKGKTSLLRDLVLINQALDPDRKVIFISSKLDTTSFTSQDYSRSSDCLRGEVKKFVSLKSFPKEAIEDFKNRLPQVIGTTCYKAIVIGDDILEGDPSYETLTRIRDIFSLTGRQYKISIGYAAHLVGGYENRDVRNEAGTIAMRFDNGGFTSSSIKYLENQLGLRRSEIAKLTQLMTDHVPGHDAPQARGWVYFMAGYNVVVCGSRIIRQHNLTEEFGESHANKRKAPVKVEPLEPELSKNDEPRDELPDPIAMPERETDQPEMFGEAAIKRPRPTVYFCEEPNCGYITTARKNFANHLKKWKHRGDM